MCVCAPSNSLNPAFCLCWRAVPVFIFPLCWMFRNKHRQSPFSLSVWEREGGVYWKYWQKYCEHSYSQWGEGQAADPECFSLLRSLFVQLTVLSSCIGFALCSIYFIFEQNFVPALTSNSCELTVVFFPSYGFLNRKRVSLVSLWTLWHILAVSLGHVVVRYNAKETCALPVLLQHKFNISRGMLAVMSNVRCGCHC